MWNWLSVAWMLWPFHTLKPLLNQKVVLLKKPPTHPMKLLAVPAFAVFLFLFPFQSDAAPVKMVVTRVKGDVKMTPNRLPKPGMILKITDFLQFSNMNQAVVCIHPELGKMIFKPMSRDQVNSKLSVADLMIPYQGQRGLNGADDVQHFQTTHDSLRLNLAKDLNIRTSQANGSFLLYDFKMGAVPRKPVTDGLEVWVFATKRGTFFLHYSAGQGNSKMVAEIEFMEPEEVRNELRYLAQLYTTEEVASKKAEYMARQYKTMPDDEKHLFLSEKP